jgi:hypothetical protein
MVGIGQFSNPFSRLTISPTDYEKKITFYGADTNDMRLGISANSLNYHLEQTIDSHRFFSTGTNGNGNLLMKIQGDGKVGINQASPLSTLHVGGDAIVSNFAVGTGAAPTFKIALGSVNESKICLHPGSVPATSFYGVGVSSAALNYQVDSTASNHVFRSAGKNADGNVCFTVTGTGQLLVNNACASVGRMTFNNTNEKKITLYSTDAVTHTGFYTGSRTVYTTNRDTLEFHLQNSEGEHQFYATTKPSNTLRQLMKVHYSEQDNRPCLYVGTGGGRLYQFELEQDSAGKPGFRGV